MAHNIDMDKDINERLRKRASQHFLDSIAVKQEAEKVLPDSVALGVLAMVECLRAGGKVMACGNGGSAADAQHFAAELVGRFERERPGLAAISLATDTSILTAVANDYSFEQIFAKQVRALGTKGDILLAPWTGRPDPSLTYQLVFGTGSYFNAGRGEGVRGPRALAVVAGSQEAAADAAKEELQKPAPPR